MIKAARRRLDLADDTGATLVLALILITVVALVVGVLLSFGDTSVRTTVALRGQAAQVYGSDGAAEAAITALRRSAFNNNTSSPTYPKCFGAGATDDTLLLNNFYPGTTGGAASSAAVTCTPDPNTGAAGGLVQINDGNKPGNAILTMGTNAGEDGVNIKALNNSFPFRVHGSVVSNSNIRVTNGSLETNVGVYARTGCSGTIVSTPPPACSSGPTADPGYQFEPAFGSNAVPTYRPVPAAVAANCPGKVMTFQPGYYDDAQALSSLMDGNGACKDSVWWFTPGVYYFDFHNSGNPLLGGSDVWTVKNGQLVAGTPVDAAGNVLATPLRPAVIPGSCQNPIKDESAVGVQFVFGGDSQLRLSNTADAEICASYHTNRPPIAVFGLKDGAESLATATVKPSTVVNPPAPALFDSATVTAANLANYGDSTAATWTKATAAPSQTASFTLGGYAPTPVIPAGSVLKSATLRVVYKNSAGASGDVRTVVLTPAGGAAITSTLPSTASTVAQTASIDLYAGGTGSLATAVHNGFTGASMAYSVKLAHAGVETVDAIQLDLGYTPPAFRAQDGAIPGGNCLTITYTGGSGGQCAVMSMSTGYSGSFYIQGTTYVPKAVIDLTLNNITSQVLRFGVVARSLWVKETGSITYSGPVIEVPDNSPGFGPGGTVVYLNVYLCQAAPSCTAATGKLSLRARVLIYDPTTTPNPPARQITIQSWAVQR